MDAGDSSRNLSDIICELLLECFPVMNCESKAGYDACKDFIELAKDKAPTPRMFHLQFDCATRLGYKEGAMKIVKDYDATMEMYLRNGKCFFEDMDFHRALDNTSRAIAFAEDPILEKREHILQSCHQLLEKVNASLSLLEDTSTQPKNEDKKKKKKKKKKQQPFGSSHQQIPASTCHTKEYYEEQQLSDIVPASSSSHPKEYPVEQQLLDMVLASSSHTPKQFDDREHLYVGKHLNMNEHIKISVDVEDKNGMFHGKMHITSKHTVDVSFIPLSNEETDLDLFYFLYNSVNGFTLRAFVLHEHPRYSYMVAEHVSLAYSFFKGEQGISPAFKKVFRIIMQEFIILISNGKSIGDFRRSVFVKAEAVEGRVLPFLSLDLKKDLHSYHSFLVELLEHLGIPKILEPYLIELKMHISKFRLQPSSTRDAQLLIDCPLFWCSSERINFIFNLFEELKPRRWSKSLFHSAIERLDECKWICSWQNRIKSEPKTVLLGVLEFPLQFVGGRKNYAYPMPYDDVGYDLVRYIIAVYHHYNDVMYEDLRNYEVVQKTEIEQQLYDVFPELYLSLMSVVRYITKRSLIDDNTWIKFLSVCN